MDQGTCTVGQGECSPAGRLTRGWCTRHYARVRKHGDQARVDKPGCKPGPIKICSVNSCDEPVNSHGLCGKHDQRRRRTGDPLTPSSVIEDPEERFLSKVRKEGSPGGCWVWTASLFPDGYGQFSDGKTVGAHRWSYEHFVEAVPDHLELDHLCHTRERLICLGGWRCPHRRCVNPAHLEPVTRIVNRHRGVQQGKLSADAVAALHARWVAGESVIALAQESGVKRGALYKRFRRLAA